MGYHGRFQRHDKPTFPDAPKQKREVFGTHSNTAHAWAQQSIDHGRSGDGRMFWRGRIIYSYGTHHAVAAFTDGTLQIAGSVKRVVLFNSDTYSVSTSQHHNEALSALRGLPVVTMRVPYVDALPSHPGGLTDQNELNAKWLLDQFTATAKALANPRKKHWQVESMADRIALLPDLLEPLRDYCRAFDLSLPAGAENAVEQYAAAIRAAFAKYEASAPKRAKDASKRAKRTMLADAALRGRVYAFIEGVGPPLTAADTGALNRWRKWRAPAADSELALRYLAAYQRAYPQPAWEPAKRLTVEQWQAGEGHATQYFTGRSDQTNTLCRRVAERLETSRGAVVPWPHAVKVFRRAQRCRAAAQSWERNGEKIPVGTFQLDAIEADGTIHAGCHSITWSEMLRLAVREIPQEVRPTYPLPVATGG